MLYTKKKGKKVKICSKVVFRKNLFSQGIGLTFHKKIVDEAHIFVFNYSYRIAVTMIFVFFPIDVLFLEKNKIVEMKRNLKPFSGYNPLNKASKVIEIPAGFITKYGLKVGDELFTT